MATRYYPENLTRLSIVQHTLNSKYTLLASDGKKKSHSKMVETMQTFYFLFTSSPWALRDFLGTLDDTSLATFMLFEVKKQNKIIILLLVCLLIFQQTCI